MEPEPIPPEVKELFDYLMFYARSGDLGLISTLDKATFETRFTLFGRHHTDAGPKLVPLGFLSTTTGDAIIPPGLEPEPFVFQLEPERWDEFLAYGSNHPGDIDRWADDGGP